MTRLCRNVETALGRPAHTLSEAERLHLEHHLSECGECRDVSALSRTVGDMIQSAPRGLSESARERAIAGAFERAAHAQPVPRAARWGLPTGFVVAAAALLLLGLRVWHAEPQRGEVLATTMPKIAEQPALRDTTSSVAAPGSGGGASTDDDDDAWIESASGDTRQFAGAHVKLAPGTRLRFARAANTLELWSGEITLDVEHQHERPFAVLTQSFRVEVLGTQFVVSPAQVTVLRGHVQVRERANDALIADLHTGQHYRRLATGAASRTSTMKPSPAKQGMSRAQEATRTSSRQHVSDGVSAPVHSVVDTVSPAIPSESASELIRQTRAALGSADVSNARKLLQRAERAAQQVGERAEVGMLEAECELLARKPAAAVRAYLRVADRFATLSAGENALFAAAQLRLRERDTGAARGLFERYLLRYPQGRFADEARAHLAGVR